MTGQRLMGFALCSALLAHACFAAPILSVYPLGLNGSSNREWAVDVALDPGLGVSSMAVELAFAVDEADLLDVDVNTAVWDMENIGANPFTGTNTEGLWLDMIGDRAFGAFGSVIVTTFDPVRLFTIETLGNHLTTLRYGTAASGDPNLGNVIAQSGQGFGGYTGSLTVPEPASATCLLLSLLICAAPRAWRRMACSL